jgi:hypothetical protein
LGVYSISAIFGIFSSFTDESRRTASSEKDIILLTTGLIHHSTGVGSAGRLAQPSRVRSIRRRRPRPLLLFHKLTVQILHPLSAEEHDPQAGFLLRPLSQSA